MALHDIDHIDGQIIKNMYIDVVPEQCWWNTMYTISKLSLNHFSEWLTESDNNIVNNLNIYIYLLILIPTRKSCPDFKSLQCTFINKHESLYHKKIHTFIINLSSAVTTHNRLLHIYRPLLHESHLRHFRSHVRMTRSRDI